MCFTYYKHKVFALVVLAAMFSGVTSLSAKTSNLDIPSLIEHARQLLEIDELYEAKRVVAKVLEERPEHEEAEQLMAEIIERELSTFMEVEEEKVVEEYSPEEKRMAIKTWLERANGLFDIRQYHQALLAAEKVFEYDTENIEASQLIDKIKKKAYKDGKGETLILQRMYDNEVKIRTETYIDQAKGWMQAGRWGSARLALEKTLLLEPKHSEALRMYKEVKSNSEMKIS